MTADETFPLLAREFWEFRRYPGGIIAAGIFDNNGRRHWVKFALSDLPNEFIGEEDLLRIDNEAQA